MIGMKNTDAVAPGETREPWQLRVIIEKNALNENIGKLAAFLLGEQFPKLTLGEQSLLTSQLTAMQNYRSILAERIDAWDTPLKPEPEVELGTV